MRDRHAYNADDIATRAIQTATARRATLIGQDAAASVVVRLAHTVPAVNAELAQRAMHGVIINMLHNVFREAISNITSG